MDVEELISELTPEIAKALGPGFTAQVRRNTEALSKLGQASAVNEAAILNILKTHFPVRYEPFETYREVVTVHEALHELRRAEQHMNCACDLMERLRTRDELFKAALGLCKLVQFNSKEINRLSDSTSEGGDVIGEVMAKHFAGAPKDAVTSEELMTIHEALHEVRLAFGHVDNIEAIARRLPQRLKDLAAATASTLEM